MSIHIPVWLLWTMGGIAAATILVLAAFGICYFIAMRAFSRSMGHWFGY